ncbi:phenoloxidase-activating enzyme-like [Anticarsia gemmatalis]|uniref:phenoloxidase-activating enzyme-like n=1 Tax=Anticarsia gemmatalis TaxID=129554 RepID=UPI003F7629C3
MFLIKLLFICSAICCVANGEQVNCAKEETPFPPDPKSGCCGVNAAATSKIIGNQTPIDQYPWTALIEYEKDGELKTLCGGVLISRQYVMTAAHCVTGSALQAGTPKSIRLGEYDLSHDGPDCMKVEGGGEDCTEGPTSIPIEKIIAHPEYRDKKNDIALIKLARVAPYTDFVRPICLPTTDMTLRTDSFRLTAAGWWSNEGSKIEAAKKTVDLPFVKLDDCKKLYENQRRVDLWKGQLCAGGEKDKGTCRGSGGSPLMFENGRAYEAIGIVSFGAYPCGQENKPDVYTNVYEYLPWIKSNIVA